MLNPYPNLLKLMQDELLQKEKKYGYSKKDEWKSSLFIFLLVFGCSGVLFGSLFLSDYLKLQSFYRLSLIIGLPILYLVIILSIGFSFSKNLSSEIGKWWENAVDLDFLSQVDISKLSPNEKNVFAMFLSSSNKPWAWASPKYGHLLWPQPPWELFFDEKEFIQVAQSLEEEHRAKVILQRLHD